MCEILEYENTVIIVIFWDGFGFQPIFISRQILKHTVIFFYEV